ncbi:lipoprotein, putative [Borreliella bavariensis PBi]|uniref:Lipoprotein, putative n=1 Tax=Borrelia garinii subsp. bavariensis (strain ATCC BAA-2496 / DSM 23469 / PBi) TaxID=290434 RepID=A0A7I6GWY6_BORGP|nr:lipoprotein, putative [Borreliella bavariensis PBi]
MQINEQILYLKAQIDKLMFILDESEFIIFDLLIKNGFFSLINNSNNISMLANKINFRVFSNFFARVSLYSFMFVIVDYLHSHYVIENFPQKIVIS